MDAIKFPPLTRKKREFLTSVDCVIWDEAPMASGIALEIVDLIFRDLMKNNLPFGGKVIILGGDFRQVLPVVRRGNRASIINSTIKNSHLWQHFEVLKLKKNMRAISDPDFSKWLLNIGDGNDICTAHNKKSQYSIPIHSSYISEDLITDIFGSSFTTNDFGSISQRAILCPKNEHVRIINENVLQRLISTEIFYYAIDSIKADDGSDNEHLQVNFPVEYLNSINPSGLPPYCLKLKKGCIVMLLRNLSIKQGLCNGTRLVVLDFSANCLKVEIITGSHSGTIHFIPRIPLDTANDPSLPFNFVRHQFPIRLSYAITINKSQGQTFERVGLYLPEPCFTHGQLYTAFSRTVRSDCLKVQVLETPRQGKIEENVTVTDNIVYQEIFD